MNETTETKPMFEVGKTYRTRAGNTVQILNNGTTHNLPFRIVVKGEVGWATRDGCFQFFGTPDRMLSGAIEDEKPEAVDPHCVLQGQINAMGLTIAGMAAKIEIQTKMLTEHDQALLRAQCNGHQYLSDLIEEQAKQIGTLQKTVTLLIEHLGLEIGYRGLRTKPEPKPTIKGGWVNVYRYHSGAVNITPVIYKTREECECEGGANRIACIQIPDITQGEGL